MLVVGTGQGLSARKALTSMVRFLRRWGPMREKGQQSPTQQTLEALVRQAGLDVVEGKLLTGNAMNAAFVRATKPTRGAQAT